MHLSLLLAVAPLALASTHLNVLQARQGSDAFIPGTSGIVTSCANPCGEITCLRPERGDTCCIEAYGCPGGSFCLTQGYCCPDGDDPATCARQFGITLPNNFVSGQTLAASSVASTTAVPVATTPLPVSTPPASTTSAVMAPVPSLSSSASVPAYYPIPSNATVPTLPSASATGGRTPGSETFTGGANPIRLALEGVIVGAVGGLVLMLL